ncbi:MAG: hypothetical protein PHO37_01275 [Kiritimatiellae bacterium]|nr:hypothetical protein [Kiritimatiellia bacterium]
MSAVTSKEKNMLIVTAVVVLYAVAAFFYKDQRASWDRQERIYTTAKLKYAEECDLIAAKEEWNEKYTQMCSLMPVFPYDKDVDTHWLNMMDTVASQKSLSISRRQTGKEEEVGDVYELPIDCKNWDGTLESLVTFLYGLRQEGAMVEVRQLYIRPGTAPGFLKGTFSLHCAYMRGDVVESEVAAAPLAQAAANTSSGGKGEPQSAALPASGAVTAVVNSAPAITIGEEQVGEELPMAEEITPEIDDPNAAANEAAREQEAVEAALKVLREP